MKIELSIDDPSHMRYQNIILNKKSWRIDQEYQIVRANMTFSSEIDKIRKYHKKVKKLGTVSKKIDKQIDEKFIISESKSFQS